MLRNKVRHESPLKLTGNVVISVIAGVAAAIVLFALGSKYSVALAVVVAILDLVPLAGATMAAVIVSAVVFVELGWVKGVIIIVFFLLYQQLENHVLQPVIYGRTVRLSPLVVLISVLIGAELAGILGALAAIPVAGIVQAVGREFLRYRSETRLRASLARPQKGDLHRVFAYLRFVRKERQHGSHCQPCGRARTI